MTYQPYQPYVGQYMQPVMAQGYTPPQAAQPYQQPVNGIVKVNGRESALQYQLPPNSMSPALFDANGRTFYVVSTDGAGAKTVEAFDFHPHVEERPQPALAGYVGRDEFDALAARVESMMGGGNALYAAVPEPAAEPPVAAHARPAHAGSPE